MNVSTLITSLAAQFAVVDSPYQDTLERAIHIVESGGRLTGDKPILGDWCPRRKVHLSRGPLQISRAYHQDSGVDFPYEMVDDLEHALLTYRAYMHRYARPSRKPEDMTWFEMKARMHNGGPRGHWRLEATQPYWDKIVPQLKSPHTHGVSSSEPHVDGGTNKESRND